MTPLALQIVRQLTLPTRKRTIDDQCGLLSMMDDIHCFEITEVLPLAVRFCARFVRDGGVNEVLSFLPAPKTWVEWQTPEGHRVGFHLDGIADPREPTMRMAFQTSNGQLGALWAGEFSLHPVVGRSDVRESQVLRYVERDRWFGPGLILGALPMINTPHVIGRRQHMPHRGLERNLLRLQRTVGRFPLHAWTEIQLRVAPISDASGDAPAEAHLTGQRALHFCRAHIRVRGGMLEIVRAHWRGDAALGIKRSRYRLSA